MTKKTAIIIGAGPAGLTAAYELLTRSDVHPIVLECSDTVGGLSRTHIHNGNRLDIGGHRFFTKSERVMQWWQRVLPIERCESELTRAITLRYKGKTALLPVSEKGPDPENEDDVMLVRERRSSIFHNGALLTYPIEVSFQTLTHLGIRRSIEIGVSYLLARLFPIRDEKTLEDFFINRFGKKLYNTFFRSYSEKVWGKPCAELSPNWGAQRVKSLSLGKTILHALFSCFPMLQRFKVLPVETSLIEHFLYPKFGPGHMWEAVAEDIKNLGGEIRFENRVCGIDISEQQIDAIRVSVGEETHVLKADYVFSSMPLSDFFSPPSTAPREISQIGTSLEYRDFMIVGLLLDRASAGLLSDTLDNWIYIQEPNVQLGRIQIFNNWSPYLVRDPDTIWLGLEYFCEAGEELWRREDDEIVRFARDELQSTGLVAGCTVLDSTVVRVPKAYPSYSGAYADVARVQEYLSSLENLYPLGRNGTHSYNNQDHSMLTAMQSVDSLLEVPGSRPNNKNDVWSINVEQEYQESLQDTSGSK